jgi:hypothetical protein
MDRVAGKQMDTILDSVAGQEIDSLAAKDMDSVHVAGQRPVKFVQLGQLVVG